MMIYMTNKIDMLEYREKLLSQKVKWKEKLCEFISDMFQFSIY